VKIIEVDSERRRISLSIKQASTEGPPIPEEIELESEEEPESKAEVPTADVLEAAMAPEVETAKPELDEEAEDAAAHAKPLGEETIEAIVADLKRRQSGE